MKRILLFLSLAALAFVPIDIKVPSRQFSTVGSL